MTAGSCLCLGRSFCKATLDGKRQSLQRLLVERLAEKLKLNVELNPFCELNDLVCAYLEQPRTRLADLYPLIAKAAKELAPDVAVPESLLKLARIPKFDYFVSLTFDSLMARALDTVRFGARPERARLHFRSTSRPLSKTRRSAGLPRALRSSTTFSDARAARRITRFTMKMCSSSSIVWLAATSRPRNGCCPSCAAATC